MSLDSQNRSHSSWLGSLAGLFSNPGGKRPGGQRAKRRVLQFELLEGRQLLSADLLCSIAGSAYYDAHDNGPSADDAPLQDVTIRLYRDGGNNVFGGDDTALATTKTDPAGNYRFDNLMPGRYFVQQQAVAGYVLDPGQDVKTIVITTSDLAGAQGIVIDSFDSTSQAAASFSTGRTATSSAAVADAVGGHRDLFVQLTSPYGSLGLGANTAIPDVLDFSAGSASSGTRRVIWDGPGGDPQVVNPTGLNHLDLTSGGAASGIRVAVGADHDDGSLVLKIFTNSTNWSIASLAIPNTGDGTAGDEVFVRFADFAPGGGTGANFADVGAIQLDINGPRAMDGQLDSVAAVGPTVFTAAFANRARTDLEVLKAGSPSPVKRGQQLTYVLTATNYGPSAATGVTITDTLPAGVTYASATPSKGSSSFAGNVVTIALGDLAIGGSATVTILVNVNANASGTLTNTAIITGTEVDTNPANNTATVTTPIDIPVDPVGKLDIDLLVRKTARPSPVVSGALLTYTITVTNLGNDTAPGASLLDTLPAGVRFVSARTSRGAVASTAGGLVRVNLGNMAKNATATVTIVVMPYTTVTKWITNVATVSCTGVESSLANNRASIPTKVTAAPGPWKWWLIAR